MIDNELFQKQIDFWMEGLEKDELILYQRMGTEEFNIVDLEEYVCALTKSMKSSSTESAYFSILRHLSLLPVTFYEKNIFIKVIDKVVQQLILQKDGEDFDPYVAVSQIDMSIFANSELIKKDPTETESKYQIQLEKNKRLQKELDELKG